MLINTTRSACREGGARNRWGTPSQGNVFFTNDRQARGVQEGGGRGGGRSLRAAFEGCDGRGDARLVDVGRYDHYDLMVKLVRTTICRPARCDLVLRWAAPAALHGRAAQDHEKTRTREAIENLDHGKMGGKTCCDGPLPRSSMDERSMIGHGRLTMVNKKKASRPSGSDNGRPPARE